MYSLMDVKQVTTEEVHAELYKMFKSKCFYVFGIIPCPVCGKSIISIHVEHTDEGSDAYFICKHCGKRLRKPFFRFGKEKAEYKMKQYLLTIFIDKKGNEFGGLQLNEDYGLIVLEDRIKKISLEDYRIKG
jgi:transcription elongation factor Elf1